MEGEINHRDENPCAPHPLNTRKSYPNLNVHHSRWCNIKPVFSLAYLRHVGPISLQYRIPFDVGMEITKKIWCRYKLHPHHALLSCLKFCLGRTLKTMYDCWLYTSSPKNSFPWPHTASMNSMANRVAGSIRSKVRYILNNSAGLDVWGWGGEREGGKNERKRKRDFKTICST